MMHPTISILTTVYNREKYLAECIESVQNGHFQDYEHIIVDDGSTDGSVEIAQAYAAEDSRISVYQNETNLGDYPNRNKAASYATGKFIKYLDADDMLTNFMLDIMVHAMDTYPTAVLGLFDHSQNRPVYPKFLEPTDAYEKSYSGNYDFRNRSPLGAIIKRTTFNQEGGFSGGRITGDFELWLRLSATHPTVLIPGGAPGFHRTHDDQEGTIHASDCVWDLKYQIIALDKLLSTKCPVKGEELNKLVWLQTRKIARTILYGLKKHGIKDSTRMKKHVNLSWKQLIYNAFCSFSRVNKGA